jgi:hypothetical protein
VKNLREFWRFLLAPMQTYSGKLTFSIVIYLLQRTRKRNYLGQLYVIQYPKSFTRKKVGVNLVAKSSKLPSLNTTLINTFQMVHLIKKGTKSKKALKKLQITPNQKFNFHKVKDYKIQNLSNLVPYFVHDLFTV